MTTEPASLALQYRALQVVGRADAEPLLVEPGTGPFLVSELILGLSVHEPDWAWVEAEALRLTDHPDPGTRGAAATALGHLARIHGRAHLGRVLPALRRLLDDPVTARAAEDAREDVLHFVTDNADDPLGLHPGGAQ